MRIGEQATALLSCRDRYGFTHVWTATEEHRVLRRWWWPYRRLRHGGLPQYAEKKLGIETENLDRATSDEEPLPS